MSCEPGSDLDWRPAGADDGCILSCVNHLLFFLEDTSLSFLLFSDCGGGAYL